MYLDTWSLCSIEWMCGGLGWRKWGVWGGWESVQILLSARLIRQGRCLPRNLGSRLEGSRLPRGRAWPTVPGNYGRCWKCFFASSSRRCECIQKDSSRTSCKSPFALSLDACLFAWIPVTWGIMIRGHMFSCQAAKNRLRTLSEKKNNIVPVQCTCLSHALI